MPKSCRPKELTLANRLGFGVHGSVFAAKNQSDGRRTASRPSSATFLSSRPQCLLAAKGTRGNLHSWRSRSGITGYDDELWVIEMTIVSRPFVLDFAGAYLDQPPDYSEEVLADWLAEKKEQFGSRWPEVQAIIRALENYDIYMADVNPGNVSFRD